MTCAELSLTDAQQALVDARLDTVERMLMGRVSRADRAVILGEIESQIHELLSQGSHDSLNRDDVLDVLRRLDPPEAFLNQEEISEDLRHPTMVSRNSLPPVTGKGSISNLGRIGGITGLCSPAFVLLAVLGYVVAIMSDSTFPLIVGLCAAFLMGWGCSLVSLVLSILGRTQGVMPVVGIVTSLIFLPFWMLAPIFLMISNL